LLQDTKVANQLRAIITNLESSSRKLDEDLEALQHNFLLRGFFKKKAVKDKAGL
jgi:phospholipid/cholesterol/gamma-HCH transport system substrate-binding protein